MNPEMQILVDRVEALERRAGGWRSTATIAILLAVAAIVIPFLRLVPGAARAPAADRARFSVVEANRFLLRDLDGKVAGGLEAGRDSTVKLVLGGRGGRGAAFLEVHGSGIVDLTLRAADGGMRAALVAGESPSFSLAGHREVPGVSMRIAPDGSGSIQVADPSGRLRFRAP